MLYLKPANPEDWEKEWAFVREMPADENGLTNQWAGISREEFRQTALPRMLDSARGENLPEGYVPATFFFLWNGEEIIGQYRVRHYLNDSLRDGAGHIGCFIAREHRGKGYGTQGLHLALEAAQALVSEKEFYLRVNKDNPASLRAMLRNGGRIVREGGSAYFVRIPNPGAR